jgi:hypothetical protein
MWLFTDTNVAVGFIGVLGREGTALQIRWAVGFGLPNR